MKKLKYIILTILVTSSLFAEKIPGLNIYIYQQISGIWAEDNRTFNLNKCHNCDYFDFGWGKSKSMVNTFFIIDPADNNFHFAGLHAQTFRRIKKKNKNTIDIELNFVDGSIQRYRVTILKNKLIKIIDNGSDQKYDRLHNYFKKEGGPNLKKGKYGKIKGTYIRIRKKPNLKSKIFGIIPKDDKIFTILKTNKKFKIGNEKWYWYKIVSNSGYIGWVYGKYIIFE